MNHKWSDPTRPSRHLSERVCIRCGLKKITHHEDRWHWAEYRAADGSVVEAQDSRRAPGCAGEGA